MYLDYVINIFCITEAERFIVRLKLILLKRNEKDFNPLENTTATNKFIFSGNSNKQLLLNLIEF